MAETDMNTDRIAFVESTTREVHARSFLFRNKWVGGKIGDGNYPVVMVDDFEKVNGAEKAVYYIRNRLNGDGVPGDNTLEGNEEELNATAQEIFIDQIRNAVISKGRMSEYTNVVKARKEAFPALVDWQKYITDELFMHVASGTPLTKYLNGKNRPATSKLNLLAFSSSISAPTTNRKFYAGAATSTATLTDSDTMSWSLLCELKEFAQTHNIPPLIDNGRECYIVVMSPAQGRDLRLDPTYLAAAKDAREKGEKNELFTGDFMNVNGLILYESTRIPNTFGLAADAKWGADGNVQGAQALLFGAQAIGYANIKSLSTSEEEEKDYKNKIGISKGAGIGFKKSVAKSSVTDTVEDWAVISVYTAAASKASAALNQ